MSARGINFTKIHKMLKVIFVTFIKSLLELKLHSDSG